MIKRLLRSAISILAIASMIFIGTTDSFATNAGTNGTATGGCTSPLGWCVDATTNGATWIRIPYNSNAPTSLKGLLSGVNGYLEASNAYQDSTVSNCKNSGGYVYTLVTPITRTQSFAGPVPMNIAKSIYDGFQGYPVPYVPANDVLDIFNSSAINGMINGYTYDDNSRMSWFCGAAEAGKTTTYQAHTTLKVGSTTVKSGWDSFNSGNHTTDQAKVTVKFTHKLKRTDQQNVTSSAKWKLATADDGLSSSQIGTNNDRLETLAAKENKALPDTQYEVTLAPSETKTICQGINHELEVKVNNNGARTNDQPGTRGSSKACVTITRKAQPVTNTSSVTTRRAYIGETTTTDNRTGSHTIYFYVGSSVGQPDDTLVRGGGHVSYGEGESSQPGSDDGKDYNGAICNYYGSLCRGYEGEVTSNNITINDDANLVGAKVCAASSSRNSVYKETRTRIKYISYVNAEGESVEEPVEEPYDVYDYYWSFSDLSCSPIAKRPNFQVLGGAAYSSDKIVTSQSSKVADGPAQNKTFGSWSEYLTIAGDSIKNFGSGAALRGGSEHSNLADNSPLTIANEGNIGYSGIAGDRFVSAIKSRFIDNDNYNHDRLNIIKLDNNADIDPVQLPADKLNIIFGTNINIPYTVTSPINAWIIAEGTLNTCSGVSAESLNSEGACSQPLTINGLVYAETIKLIRTAGAWAGNNSADPAETVNLTAGDYVRAYQYSVENFSQPVELYTQELAPRI